MIKKDEYYKRITSNINDRSELLVKRLIKIEKLLLDENNILEFRVNITNNGFYIKLLFCNEFGDSVDVLYENENVDEIMILEENILYDHNESNFGEYVEFINSKDSEEQGVIVNGILFEWFKENWKKIKDYKMKNIYLIVDNDYDGYDLINDVYKNDSERYNL